MNKIDGNVCRHGAYIVSLIFVYILEHDFSLEV